jgi:UDP-glucose 4-epimerase
MKILITGAAGFIASHIADAYISLGHEVCIIDNLVTGNKSNLNPKAKFYESDITDPKISKIFEKEKFDVINHHAAQIDVRKSVTDPIYDTNVNVLGSVNLLQNSVNTGVKKIIFASSGGAIYGEQEYYPADEKHPEFPVSQYGVAKLSFEKYMYAYKFIYGINYIALRYSNVYGPRQNPHGEAGVVAIFTEKMLSGITPIINGNGKQTRDYVFVDDVVQANIKALDCNESGAYNVGTGIESDVNKLFHVISSHIGNFEEKHGEAKQGEQMRSVISTNKIENVMEWKLSTDLETGLKKTVNWFKQKTK